MDPELEPIDDPEGEGTPKPDEGKVTTDSQAAPPQPVVPLDPALISSMIQVEAAKMAATITPRDTRPRIEGTNIPAPQDWDEWTPEKQQRFIAKEEAKMELHGEIEAVRNEFRQEIGSRDAIEVNKARISKDLDDDVKPFLEELSKEYRGVFAQPLTKEQDDFIRAAAVGRAVMKNKGVRNAAPIDGEPRTTTVRAQRMQEVTTIENMLPKMKGSKILREIAARDE